MVEFALILPLILYILVGILQVGWLLSDYMILTNATAVGARYFAGQAGSTTANANTVSQVKAAASGLTLSSLTITTSVNGTACTDNSTPTCGTALINNKGSTANVAVSYTFTPIIISSLYAMPATLTHAITERVM